MQTKRDNMDDSQESEIIYINPRKDVLEYTMPLTHETDNQTEEFKKIAAKALADKIISMIEPEYLEMRGFELMKYKIVVKKYHS